MVLAQLPAMRRDARVNSGRLQRLIFVAMAAGLLVGVALHHAQHSTIYAPAVWWLDLFGPVLFVGALKMLIAPLILASIVTGVTSLPNLRELGSIGYRTIAYYALTTTVAVLIGLVFVLTIQPGNKPASIAIRQQRSATLEQRRATFERTTQQTALDEGTPRPSYVAWLAEQEGETQRAGEDASRYNRLSQAQGRTAGDMFRDDIVKPVLMNPFESLSSDPPNALGIIFFSLLLGIACSLAGKAAKPVVKVFHGFNAVIMKITHWLMSLSPYAIACIIATLVAKHGLGVFRSLAWYAGTVIVGIAVHVAVLFAICRVLGKTSPRSLWTGIREAWLVAFSTRSSAATLPVTVKCVTGQLGVRGKVANFTLPLGATMNMDGTALYEGVAILFLIQTYGGLDDVSIPMSAITTVLIFITAVLASVGAAAVPDAGLVTMVLVASAVHLPIYYIPLIFAVDAFLDMFRTSTNVLGDAVGAVVIDRMLPHDGDA